MDSWGAVQGGGKCLGVGGWRLGVEMGGVGVERAWGGSQSRAFWGVLLGQAGCGGQPPPPQSGLDGRENQRSQRADRNPPPESPPPRRAAHPPGVQLPRRQRHHARAAGVAQQGEGVLGLDLRHHAGGVGGGRWGRVWAAGGCGRWGRGGLSVVWGLRGQWGACEGGLGVAGGGLRAVRGRFEGTTIHKPPADRPPPRLRRHS